MLPSHQRHAWLIPAFLLASAGPHTSWAQAAEGEWWSRPRFGCHSACKGHRVSRQHRRVWPLGRFRHWLGKENLAGPEGKATCTILTAQESEDYTTQGQGLGKFTEEQYRWHASNKPRALSTQAGSKLLKQLWDLRTWSNTKEELFVSQVFWLYLLRPVLQDWWCGLTPVGSSAHPAARSLPPVIRLLLQTEISISTWEGTDTPRWSEHVACVGSHTCNCNFIIIISLFHWTSHRFNPVLPITWNIHVQSTVISSSWRFIIPS